MNRNTSVTLGNHFEQFINHQVKDGRYSSTSEVIRAALRLLEERENKLTALRSALMAGEKSGFVDYALQDIISDLDKEGK
jgi:antitoxin ParD1/3/4